jgi:hypothetical protein
MGVWKAGPKTHPVLLSVALARDVEDNHIVRPRGPGSVIA